MRILATMATALTLACACGGSGQANQPASTAATKTEAPPPPAATKATAPAASAAADGEDEDGHAGAPPPVVVGGVLDNPDDGAPPPPPPPPRKPLIVPQIALEHQRLAGSKTIDPDKSVQTAMSRAGQNRLVTSVKMCLSDRGAITSVDVLKSSGHASYDEHIRKTMLGTWRYRPFVVNGKKVPVCASVTFIYQRAP